MQLSKRRTARINCFISLYLYDVGKIPPQEILSTYIQNKENPGVMNEPEVRKFYEELFLATVNNISEIDDIIKKSAKKWDFNSIFAIDKAILRMATAEMIYMKNQIPVVIDEAIEISKMYSPNEEKGPDFINGVLDTIAKTYIENVKK